MRRIFVPPVERVSVWNSTLKAKEHSRFDLESFDSWWKRNYAIISHLNKEICEQWIYKYGPDHPHSYLELDKVSWTQEMWTPEHFVQSVRSATDNRLAPEFDYEVFNRDGFNTHPTATALNLGSWDFAPIVLYTPGGFLDRYRAMQNYEYLLIEGHQRRRYLNALVAQGQQLSEQRVFVLISPDILDKYQEVI
ncbi:hypothetical protein ABIE58_002566 [Roseovarius sp. MBR-78]|uniref:hypothetical protein n=1 Tax=Roseovarius sp. MBR-78 TaxID=3156460 RepID=UPI003395B6BA